MKHPATTLTDLMVKSVYKRSYAQKAWSGTLRDLETLGTLVVGEGRKLDPVPDLDVTVNARDDALERTAPSITDAMNGIQVDDVSRIRWGRRYGYSLTLTRQSVKRGFVFPEEAVELSVEGEDEGWVIATREKVGRELRRLRPNWYWVRGMPAMVIGYAVAMIIVFGGWLIARSASKTAGAVAAITALPVLIAIAIALTVLIHAVYPSLELVDDRSQPRVGARVLNAGIVLLTVVGVILGVVGIVRGP